MLWIAAAATSVICDGKDVDVPTALAQHSKLISDLREEAERHVEPAVVVSLPLTGQQVLAWLACATSIRAGACGFETEHCDEALLLALQVIHSTVRYILPCCLALQL